MKLRLLLPLLALPVLATTGAAQNTESIAQLRRDFVTVQQQRDSLTEQVEALRKERDALQAERDALRTEQESAQTQIAAAQTSAVEAEEAVRAQKEAEMTVEMTVRAYAMKEKETEEAVQAANLAADKRAEAEQERDAAKAAAEQAIAERDTAQQAAATALAAKAAMQNELYAAQIRIENLSRALAARSGTSYRPTGITPTQVPLETPVAQTPLDEPARANTTPALPDTAPVSKLRTHTVGEGESLSLISFKYYKSPNKWDRIVAANPTKLRNPDQLRPGMVLIIP